MGSKERFKVQGSMFKDMDVLERLKEFMENEARSCSMDFGCITPLYVYRMWNGSVPIEDIETAFNEVKF